MASVVSSVLVTMPLFSDGSPEPFTIYEFEVAPLPVLIANGAMIEYSLQIGLNEEIPVGSTITLKIRTHGIIPITIPCIDLETDNGIIQVGSW